MARREPHVKSIKRDKRYFGRKYLQFANFFETLEREKKKKVKVFFGDARGFVGLKSSGQELKFITSKRATRRHQK